jgi:hypothetical protein
LPARRAQAPDEVQTLTIGGTPTGGTFKLAFDGQVDRPDHVVRHDATLSRTSTPRSRR